MTTFYNMMYKSVRPCLYCVHLRLLLNMSQEAAVHIGPEINCDDLEVVNNEINFICCKCSKKVMLHWIYSIGGLVDS